MSKKQNAYLARQEEKRRQMDYITRAWAHQVDFDAIAIVLGDPAVMGKDTFGEKRMNRIFDALNEVIPEIERGLVRTVEASYVRAQTDRELKKKRRGSFFPWEERYLGWDDRGI